MRICRNWIIAATVLVSVPAMAKGHPNPENFLPVDVAAVAAYAPESPVRDVVRRHHAKSHKVKPEAMHPRRHKEAAAPARRKAVDAPKAAGVVKVIGTAVDALALAAGALVGLPEGYADALATPMPDIVRHRPRRIEGNLTIGSLHFPFASGGPNGWSVPYGVFPIDDSAGDWGKRHGALGLNDNTIHDPQLRRDREGIEIHKTNHMASAGCVVIPSEHWREFKHAVTAMVDQFGHAFLHVTPKGATITPTKIGEPMIIMADNSTEDDDEPRTHRQNHYVHHRVKHIHYAHHSHHRHLAST